MKAITILQPWAELIIQGYKHNETRSWLTSHTGPIAIHAAKFRKLDHEVYKQIAYAIGIKPEKYNGSWLYYMEHGIPDDRFGAVLGIVTLEKVLPTTIKAASPKEKLLGDFSAGRYAWQVKVIEKYDKPIPARGKQGLWNWDPPSTADNPETGSE